MKISYLKINGFGKIKDKEINFKNNINLVQGKNEAGKTTLLKFIFSMFYGLSKNKNGKEISDFDKYKPWVAEDFSGKLKYVLDNGEEYEVFREFSKKNPKIYNKNSEDISKQFNIDKTKGNQFFYDQTKIDDVLFLSTNIVEQQAVILDSNNQNMLTQKIANILSTGEDNTSYKKVMGNLSRKLIEEVGTDRTLDRPMNKLTEQINEILELKNELEFSSNTIESIKTAKKELEVEIKRLNSEIELLNEIKIIKENEKIKKEEININNKIKNEYQEKIDNLKNNIKYNYKKEENKKLNNRKKIFNIINLIIINILIILNILINFIKLNTKIENIIIYFSLFYLIINLIFYFYKNKKNKKINNKINLEKIKIEKEIEILQENKKYKEKEITKLEEEILNKNNKNIELLNNKFKNVINKDLLNYYLNMNLEEINNKIEKVNMRYTDKKIELNTAEIKENQLLNKLENKVKYEEKLGYLNQEKQELLSFARSINIAKETLEEAYDEMKGEITPKFTTDLSLIIEKISSGKYKKAIFDVEKGLIIEKSDGEYINCNRLSIGTIDQLYLSLRLSAMQQISEENMPIILDESFAYYDDERLTNVLDFINHNYKDNQLIIFTCSDREKQIMEKLSIEYNLIEL